MRSLSMRRILQAARLVQQLRRGNDRRGGSGHEHHVHRAPRQGGLRSRSRRLPFELRDVRKRRPVGYGARDADVVRGYRCRRAGGDPFRCEGRSSEDPLFRNAHGRDGAGHQFSKRRGVDGSRSVEPRGRPVRRNERDDHEPEQRQPALPGCDNERRRA